MWEKGWELRVEIADALGTFVADRPFYRLLEITWRLPRALGEALLFVKPRDWIAFHLVTPKDALLLPGLLGEAFILAYRITNDVFDASDAVASALYRVARSPVEPNDFAAYFMQVVRRAALDVVRSRRRRRHHERVAVSDVPTPDLAVESSAATVIRMETAEHVRSTVAALPYDLRVVVELHYFEDLTRQQIASQLGKPKTTVDNRLHKARGMLRQSLGPLVA